jgi:Glycosyltransferase family 87
MEVRLARSKLHLGPSAHDSRPAGHRLRHGPLLAAAGSGLLVALGMVHWLQAVASFLDTSTYNFSAYDFRSFYAAGRLVADGRAHELYARGIIAATGRTGGEPYFNPPFFALLWAPFSLMPFDAAYRAWTLMNLGLLAVNCWLLWRIGASVPQPWRAVLVAAFVTSAPVSHGIVLGQYSLLLTASWGSAYLLMRGGRDRLAGCALTPLLTKPEMLVPLALFLLWKRRRGALMTLLPATVACIGISVAIVGPGAAVDYPFYLIRESEFQRTDAMFGWTGVIGGVFGAGQHNTMTLAAATLAVGTLATGFVALRGRSGALATSWLIVAMATVLADLHLFFQDTAILAPVAVAYLAAVPGTRRARAAAMMAVGWVILWFEPFMSTGVPVNIVFGLYLAVAIACLLPARRSAEAATGAQALAA